MKTISKLLKNGLIPLLPIFAWNYIFISKLPLAYQPQLFNQDIPGFIILGENLFRFIIFIFPVFFELSMAKPVQRKGLAIFIIGVVLYFVSWLILVYMPGSSWSHHVIGFSAPATTPLIWLIGLSMMMERCYVFNCSKWHYIIPVILFSGFHVYHSIYVFSRMYV